MTSRRGLSLLGRRLPDLEPPPRGFLDLNRPPDLVRAETGRRPAVVAVYLESVATPTPTPSHDPAAARARMPGTSRADMRPAQTRIPRLISQVLLKRARSPRGVVPSQSVAERDGVIRHTLPFIVSAA